MEFVYVAIGVIGALFLHVDKFSNIFVNKEETFDAKKEHYEGKYLR